jgi:hypothetical protein
MVSFVPPEQCSFSVDDGDAVIRLAGVTVSATQGWSLLNRATLVVVDGPGDEGFLVRRASPDGSDSAPDGWDSSVAAGGGAWLELPETSSRVRAHLIDE